MLKKSMRKKLLELNSVDMLENESNPSQTLRRLRDEGNQAINDLALLAQKLPADTFKDIFNYTNIGKLFKSLFSETEFDGGNSALDMQKTELASLLARIGINFCKKQYEQKIETNSVLNESTIAQLNKSIDICDTIAFKMKIPIIHAVSEKEGLIYLFNWNKIEEVHEMKVSEIKCEDTKKFVSFLENERKDCPLTIIHKINLDIFFYDDAREFEFTDVGGYRYKGILEIDRKGKKGSLLAENDNHELVLERPLIVKMENEDLYVYMKK